MKDCRNCAYNSRKWEPVAVKCDYPVPVFITLALGEFANPYIGKDCPTHKAIEGKEGE